MNGTVCCRMSGSRTAVIVSPSETVYPGSPPSRLAVSLKSTRKTIEITPRKNQKVVTR